MLAIIVSTVAVATVFGLTFAGVPLFATSEAPMVTPTPSPTPHHKTTYSGGGYIAPPTPSPTPIPVPPGAYGSLNWAGYAAVSNLTAPTSVVSNVSAYWTVPEVDPAINNAFSSAWVGIGGVSVGNVSDNTLIQTGTTMYVQSGIPRYYAWYELLPDNSLEIPSIGIFPGDEMYASVALLNETTNYWNINITDITSHDTFSKNVTYESSRVSADWIVERPYVNGELSELANFGNVTFTNCTATLTTMGELNAFPDMAVVMYKGSQIIATVTAITDEGTKFTVMYTA
ncbi:Peptidase A4 family protein [uncultured archaeon]|nr:Peptidase A4 family protein [uncultured archaeon]